MTGFESAIPILTITVPIIPIIPFVPSDPPSG